MNKEELLTRILLISNRQDDADKIRNDLAENMRVPWSLTHCINTKEAASRINKADIIILQLEIAGLASPQQVFRDVGEMVFEVPIIALTDGHENSHGLATYVMEKGAADTIIRGQFGRLVDAIEFALIRQKIVTAERKARDRELSDSKEANAATLQTKTDADTAELTASKAGRADDSEKSRQTLRMFMGGYSVDQDKKKV